MYVSKHPRNHVVAFRFSILITLFAAAWFGIPLTTAYAAVTFSEIAWMGSVESANHEWIELYNDGAAVSLEGWTISDGQNLSIALAGTAPSEQYVVLERTSDDSVPGAAFLIYTGALVNTGATLQLRRSDGTLVDQVSGGEDWERIGGDNTTKETAQYTTAGWVTAEPTPSGPPPTAAARSDEESDADAEAAETDTTDVSDTTKSTKSTSGKTVSLTLPGVTLTLAITGQTVGYVHQPLSFTATPAGVGDAIRGSLDYQWNFGDGSVADGREVEHVYHYPGTYVVTTYASYKRQEQVARHEITILPVSLSLTTDRDGAVQVNNDSPYELDLSGYTVKGRNAFVFPPRTIILPGQTITIPRQRLGGAGDMMLAVYDTEAALVASRLPDTARNPEPPATLAAVTTPTSPPAPPTPRVSSIQTSAGNFGFAPSAQPAAVALASAPEQGVVGTSSATDSTEQPFALSHAAEAAESNLATRPTPTNRPVAFIALAVILALAILALLAAPRSPKPANTTKPPFT